MATKTFYRVIKPGSFSSANFSTLDQAKKEYQRFGECPRGSEKSKHYWKEQQGLCKIVKVTEITEEV